MVVVVVMSGIGRPPSPAGQEESVIGDGNDGHDKYTTGGDGGDGGIRRQTLAGHLRRPARNDKCTTGGDSGDDGDDSESVIGDGNDGHTATRMSES